MKKITVLTIAAIFFMASLTACGNSAEDVAGASVNMAQDTDFNTTDDIASAPETPDEIILVPETYEDYINLSNIYLQTEDVLQALAILDEGIEKLSAEEQGTATQVAALLSQRREYVLAGMVAVRTEYVEYEYDEKGEILSGRVLECDENGNEIKDLYYDKGGEISRS